MRVALLTFISALFAACLIAPAQAQNTATISNDIAALNYALALESLEATYYSCYLYPLNTTNADCNGRGYVGYSQADFIAAGYNASVFAAVVAIGRQELSHQALLNATIQAFQPSTGIAPVSRCTYNLGAIQAVTSVATFLTLSATLENTGVSAYAGAVNTITNPDLLQVAVSIATVEARHAAWLNQLLGNQPYASSGFDTYRTPNEIAASIGSVFVGTNCVAVPTTRPYGVAGIAGSTATNQTGPLAGAAGVQYSATERANDLLLLNYALTLEQLEASFYNAAGAIFNQTSFNNAGLPSAAYNNFVIIGNNENTHVAVLRSVISAYGGSPVGNCSYNFTTALSSFTNYLTYAQILENTGVQAYAGAANTITDTNLLRVAATIAMIEARHAAYINVLVTNPNYNNTNAFPAAYDTPLAPATVLSNVLATGLAYNCPSAVSSVPVVLPYAAGIASSSGAQVAARSSSSSSSTGFNGATSASVSMAMIVVAIIASLALVL